MITKCPFPCTNKTEFGYCKTTACLLAPTIRVTSMPRTNYDRIISKTPEELAETDKVAEWQYKTMSVPGGKGQTYAKWRCTHCKTKQKARTKFCPECGYRMKNGG